MKMARNLKNNN